MSLHIVVCIKQVANPDYFSEITMDPDTGAIQRDKVPSILNPVDENALEEALRLKDLFGGKVTACSMGPPQAREVLDWALTLGADEAVLLCDRSFGGADSLATARVLAAGIKAMDPVDLVLCGNEAADGATQQVGPQLAEILGYPHICNVGELKVDRDLRVTARRIIEYGYLTVEAALPLLVTVNRAINQPRTVTAEGFFALMDKVCRTWCRTDVDVDSACIGLPGSPTRVGRVYEQKNERRRRMLEGSPEEMAAATVDMLRREGLIQGATEQ